MVRAMYKLFIVVDDGSDDATPDVLANIDMVGLHVLSRRAPYAQRGKGEVLNHAWRFLHELLATDERYTGWSPENVVVIVVDADGRLNPNAPHYLAPHFGEERTGGVQSQVEIYNRKSLLGLMQHVEFSIIGWTFQLARTRWGTANMGGNGQSNRLSALDSVGGRRGPWRDKLTEDQDLGLRLMHVGWHGRHEPRSVISQQGVTSLRRLFRQRTRWAQGAWQAISHVRDVEEVRAPLVARADIVWALILPVIQLVVACTFVAAVAVAVAGDVPFFADVGPVLVFFILLTFVPTFILLAFRAKGPIGFVSALALLIPYTLYTWFLVPTLFRSGFRHMSGVTYWDKTPREPLTIRARTEEDLEGS